MAQTSASEKAHAPRGRALVIPLGPETRGHQSHTMAHLWKDELAKLLAETEPAR